MFPYTGVGFEEYVVRHNMPPFPQFGPMGCMGGMPWGAPFPPMHAGVPMNPPHWPFVQPGFDYPAMGGMGMMGGMMGMGMGMGMGMPPNFYGQHGDWAGHYCGGTEGRFES